MYATTQKIFASCSRTYQEEGVSFLYEHDEAMLLLRMGGGKTVISLTAMAELLRDGVIRSVLIVAPLAVCNNTWRDEPGQWTHTADLDITIVTGDAQARRRSMDAAGAITVTNYESLQWMMSQYPKRRWDLVVLDEVTRFNNPSSKRYKAMKPVLAEAKLRWGLTGSLGANSLEHVYNPVRAIDLGKALGPTIGPFRRQYFTQAYNGFGFDMKDGAAAAVGGRISHLCFQPDPAVYQSQLPEVVTVEHKFDIDQTTKILCEQLTQDYVAEMPSGAMVDVASAGVLVGKLQQCVSGFLYDEEGSPHQHSTERQALLEELLREAEGSPVLVFYWYSATGDWLRDKGYPDLVDNLDAWNAGTIPVAIAHPRSAGHGLNAQAGGSTLIWYEQNWSAEERAQANARLHRQGQQSTVYIHDIVARNSIDEDILMAQQTKGSVAQMIAERLGKPPADTGDPWSHTSGGRDEHQNHNEKVPAK